MPLITLTTDLGQGPYAASMKGAILRINPKARIVDISHDIPAHDIEEGAYVLMVASRHFPKAIHVGVVDPGVGGPRKAILFSTKKGLFVGPDNGLLAPAARASGIRTAYNIENEELMAASVHPAFHGRDVFAPVAAHLSSGGRLTSVGPRTRKWVDLELEEWKAHGDELEAKVLHVDNFGNLVTSIPAERVLERLTPGNTYPVELGNWSGLVPYVRTYADMENERVALMESSSGFLEVAVKEGSAAMVTGAGRRDKVTFLLT